MLCILDGAKFTSELQFHKEISTVLQFGEYYGNNLDALWDRLSTDVERPITLVWSNSQASRRSLGPAFDKIVAVLERVKNQDLEWHLPERFDYRLE